MPLVHHATKFEFVCRMCTELRADISSENDIVYLSCCCLPRPFSLVYLIKEVEIWGGDMDLEVQQRSEDLLASWYNIK